MWRTQILTRGWSSAAIRQFVLAALLLMASGLTSSSIVHNPPSLTEASLNQEVLVHNILIPNVQPTKHDQYICTSMVVDRDRESYIVQLEALADAKKAHHILLFGCRSLFNGYERKPYWECNEGNLCSDMKIIFAWAKNAPPTSLPKDVGFKIGGNSGVNFLVMQVHYAMALAGVDNSGLSLHITYQPRKYLAGILLLASASPNIPPHKEKFHVNVNCIFQSHTPINVFAYRVHAHSLGVVISGYKVSNTDGSWTLLGKGNPQWPQALYPTSEIIPVNGGDVLASRCTFNSTSRSTTTVMGSTANDEMCNFYMMYYSSVRQMQGVCSDEQYPSLTALMPADSDVPLPPNPLLEEHAIHGYHHHMGSTQQSEDTHSSSSPDPAKLTVFKKGHGVFPEVPDYNDYDTLAKTHYPDVSKEEDSSEGVIKNYKTNQGVQILDQPSAYDVHRGQIHHVVEPSDEVQVDGSRTGANEGSSVSEAPRGSLFGWFTSSAAQKESVYTDVPNWPSIQQPLGQVTSVAFDGDGNIVIFHRGPRVWGFRTFDLKNRYTDIQSGPIDVDTVLTLDKISGQLMHSWGKNMFYMPHGLFIDATGGVWVTDVALHQVFKFGPDWSTNPLITLGVRFEPDDDNIHFCKPASVAVMNTGEFFIADGYCNNRILKYSAKGELILQWGRRTASLLGFKLGVPPTYAFDIPHSLALAEDKGVILVADRENGRIQCFYTGNGTFHSQIQDPEFGGRLFGVSYSPVDGGTVYAVNGPSIGIRRVGVKGFVINFDSRETLGYFTPNDKAMSNPHDIISTPDGQYVYVAEIGPNRVWKYSKAKDEHATPKKLVDGEASVASTELLPAIGHEKAIVTPTVTQVEKLPRADIDTQDEKKTVNKAVSNPLPVSQIAGLAASTNFTVSMVIMSLLAIPVLVMVFVAVFIRLKKQGKFHGCNVSHVKGWLTGYKNPNSDRFGIGNLLNRHKGFDRVGTEDSDVDPEGSDSDVEEYNVSTAQKA